MKTKSHLELSLDVLDGNVIEIRDNKEIVYGAIYFGKKEILQEIGHSTDRLLMVNGQAVLVNRQQVSSFKLPLENYCEFSTLYPVEDDIYYESLQYVYNKEISKEWSGEYLHSSQVFGQKNNEARKMIESSKSEGTFILDKLFVLDSDVYISVRRRAHEC